ncbi:MAG: glycosyltransferase family 2 protein [Proteobacteria bacterium]|nr:glycosyltransferase family 2 protein [Pseudomonadota bacterium]
MHDLTIVIPAYNEEQALSSFLPELLEYCRNVGCKLIIVNDGSKDGTRALLDRYAEPALFSPIHHKVNRGYGGAIKSGINATKTPLVITIDADGQHRLEDVTALYDALRKNDADMVVGNRKKYKESLYRKTGKKLIHFIAGLLMPIKIHDLNSGMKIYVTSLVRQYMHLCPDNMALSDIITLVFINQRHLVVEHPITVIPRTTGKSTISIKTAFDTVLEIIHVATMFDPMRLFFPPALFFLLFSAVWGIPILLRNEGVSVGTLFLFVTGLIFFFLGLLAEQLALIRKNLNLSPPRNPPGDN